MVITDLLVALGLVLVFAGLGGIVWCLRLARRLQGGDVSEEEARGAINRLSAVNMASMGGATLGLSLLLVGLIL